ncbi:hypothetical protein [Achromobacter sp. DH1f]|uniref:hypothetical protein n=1 Tax=Achromobacter sp. DH1f TaxID=1397275 RepID=UPI0004692A6A|nr:hypothetical protein [Achromobacter sp. DH1f]
MRELLRGIERGWVEAGIGRLVRKPRVETVVATLVHGGRQAILDLPATVGMSVEAVAEKLLEARIKALQVNDLVQAHAATIGPLRAVSAAIADVVIELRDSPPTRAAKAGDIAIAAWAAAYTNKMLAAWVESSSPRFGPACRRQGRAQLDLERIGTLVNSPGIRAALAIGWVGTMGVTEQALRGELKSASEHQKERAA